MSSEPVAIYVHIPFCPTKCGYCDFNSYAMTGEIVDETVRAIRTEISRSSWRGRPAKTIFFGGGTPTFLSSGDLTAILGDIMAAHPPVDGAEITCEANPGTVDAQKFAHMREAGFNRLSLGAQSFVPEDLIRLGRVHQGLDIGKAFSRARESGFENINLDLMFGLPGQSVRAWRQNLELALSLRPEHLSLYCLTIEPNTRFHKLDQRGMLDLPDEDQQVEMYDLTLATMVERGFRPYEISNFGKPGYECQHNLAYWRCEEYLSYGPGAVGCYFDSGRWTRYTNLKHPRGYSDAIAAAGSHWGEHEELDPGARETERLMMGLRIDEPLEGDFDVETVRELLDRGWVEMRAGGILLTALGRHYCTQVALELMSPVTSGRR